MEGYRENAFQDHSEKISIAYKGHLTRTIENMYSEKSLYSIAEKLKLEWLKTVSSTFQDVDFDGSLLPLFINRPFSLVHFVFPIQIM